MLRKLVNLAAYYAQYRDYSYFKRHSTKFAKPSEKLPLIISVDVEASPRYVSSDHAEELIWGRFGDETIGITRMMDVAEAYGHRLTFFVDYCERFLYPEHFSLITKAIQSRGHDLQLHAHIELLPKDFWSLRGIDGGISLSELPYDAAHALLSFLIDSVLELGDGSRPCAFRGGNFRFSAGIIQAMGDLGLPLSFNYNAELAHQAQLRSRLTSLRWANGVIEVPLSVIRVGERYYPFDFNEFNSFSDTVSAQNYLAALQHRFGSNTAAVLLMHSWSFCHDSFKRTRKGYKNNKKIENFSRFLRELPDYVEIRTATEHCRTLLEEKPI